MTLANQGNYHCASLSFGGVLLTCVLLVLQTGCATVQGLAGEDVPSEQSTSDKIASTEADALDAASTDTNSVEVASLDGSGQPSVVADSAPLDLMICKMKVSNAPTAVDRQVSRPSSTGCINGVSLLVAPAPRACVTSGFGPRRGRMHRGVDFQSKPAGNIVAAGPGVVLTSEYNLQNRFGNWVLIDHGSDVYTAYAHLRSIDEQIEQGARVARGQVLGVMGNTGPDRLPIHLHYEIRQGDIKKARSFFNLTPINPFDLPGSCPAT